MVPLMTIGQARSYMQKRWGEENELPAISEYISFVDGVPDMDTRLSQIEEDLRDILDSEGEVPKNFDAQARSIVHKHLHDLPDFVLLNSDFWRYLGVGRFYEIVALRHPKSAKSGGVDQDQAPNHGDDETSSDPGDNSALDANWANYGAYTYGVRESLFHRLFVGASLALDSDPDCDDAYHLTRVHDVDLWQSHIIRVLTGENTNYVKALLAWFNARDTWYEEHATGRNVSGKEKTKHLRDLVKRIRRLRSNVMHEYFSYEQVEEMIATEARLSWNSLKL